MYCNEIYIHNSYIPSVFPNTLYNACIMLPFCSQFTVHGSVFTEDN